MIEKIIPEKILNILVEHDALLIRDWAEYFIKFEHPLAVRKLSRVIEVVVFDKKAIDEILSLVGDYKTMSDGSVKIKVNFIYFMRIHLYKKEPRHKYKLKLKEAIKISKTLDFEKRVEKLREAYNLFLLEDTQK